MKKQSSFLMWIVFIIMSKLSSSTKEVKSRKKRTVFDLGQHINCATKKWKHNYWNALSYNNYGCYCGTENVKSYPMDMIDLGCYYHDLCYNDIKTRDYQSVKYNSDCHAKTGTITCYDEKDTDSFIKCDCDRKLANWFRKFQRLYKKVNKGINKIEKCVNDTIHNILFPELKNSIFEKPTDRIVDMENYSDEYFKKKNYTDDYFTLGDYNEETATMDKFMDDYYEFLRNV